jgi:hypothetical protein
VTFKLCDHPAPELKDPAEKGQAPLDVDLLLAAKCFELHPNLQGSADQTTPKETASLLCCVSRGARYIPEQALRQRANLPIQNTDKNGPDISNL